MIAAAETDATPITEADMAAPAQPGVNPAAVVRRRRPGVSANAIRERLELDPGTCCPDCGGDLRLVGEDVSEILEMIAAQMKVVAIARLKKSCRRCEKMVQGEPLCAIGASTMASAPSCPIEGSMAGAGLLAHVPPLGDCMQSPAGQRVSKFDDHLPLYRQNEIFARLGADIPDSTLVDWCGRACKVLAPLADRIATRIMASDLLHADDTPIRVLDRSLRDKGLGKGVRKGRIWAYVRDQRPWAGAAPPGAVYYFAPDWKEEHVHDHLRQTRGILQADGYKGYAKLYDPEPDGTARFREAACWAHLRRDFHDIWAATKSEIAREARDRIGALCDIGRDITGQSAGLRLEARKETQSAKGRGVFCMVRTAVIPHPGHGSPGQGLSLWSQPDAGLDPVPRGWARGHRQQRGRARPASDWDRTKELAVRRRGYRCRSPWRGR